MKTGDNWIRMNRHHHLDKTTAHLSAVEGMVLWQARNIAADYLKAEVDGDDVVVPCAVLDPEELVFELGRHPDYALANVVAAFERLVELKLLERIDGDRFRLRNLAAYNRRRFDARERTRNTRSEKKREKGVFAYKAPVCANTDPKSANTGELTTECLPGQDRTGETTPLKPPHGGGGRRGGFEREQASQGARELQVLMESCFGVCTDLPTVRVAGLTRRHASAFDDVIERMGSLRDAKAVVLYMLQTWKKHPRSSLDWRCKLSSGCLWKRHLSSVEPLWREATAARPETPVGDSADAAWGQLLSWREGAKEAARRNRPQPPPPDPEVIAVCRTFGKDGEFRLTDGTVDTRTRSILRGQFVRAWNSRRDKSVPRLPPPTERGRLSAPADELGLNRIGELFPANHTGVATTP